MPFPFFFVVCFRSHPSKNWLNFVHCSWSALLLSTMVTSTPKQSTKIQHFPFIEIFAASVYVVKLNILRIPNFIIKILSQIRVMVRSSIKFFRAVSLSYKLSFRRPSCLYHETSRTAYPFNNIANMSTAAAFHASPKLRAWRRRTSIHRARWILTELEVAQRGSNRRQNSDDHWGDSIYPIYKVGVVIGSWIDQYNFNPHTAESQQAASVKCKVPFASRFKLSSCSLRLRRWTWSSFSSWSIGVFQR